MASDATLTYAYADEAFCYGAEPIVLPFDYEDLTNLPRINHKELKQDRTVPEKKILRAQIDSMFE